jgi:hypothetical protein
VVALLSLALACGEYDGGETPAENPFAAASTPSGISQAEQVAAFEATLWPLLRGQTCATCHTVAAGRAPFVIADANSTTAFRAIIDNAKVNFDQPSASRLVARVAADQHHCWNECAADGVEMLLAIENWIADIEARGGSSDGGTAVNQGTLLSNEVASTEGVENEGGLRYTNNLIAFWKFDEKTGTVARDTSGVAPAMDINLGQDVAFMESYGLEFSAGTASTSTSPSRKLRDHIADADIGTGQYSVEMWLSPANTNQQADMFRYSNDIRLRQRLYQYDVRNRSLAPAARDDGGIARMLTYDVDRDLQAGLQHTVMTFDRYNGMRVYVNGVYTDDVDEAGGALLWNWADNSRITLGNGGENGWFGQFRMLAIYRQALSQEQIEQNFLAGVGLRLTLNFDISAWAGPGSRVEMSVSQMDDKSYLLCQPTVVTNNVGIKVRGMRVLVNGQVSPVGQAFARVNTRVNSARQQISPHCAIVENPPGPDSFQLAFEGLGGWVDPVDEPIWPAITYDYTNAEVMPTNGVRDFARVNETLGVMTGVDPGDPTIQGLYNQLQQQLPSGPDIRTFVSSNQVGVVKLALEYCTALVDTPADRDALFGASNPFDWNAAPAVAFLDDGVNDNRLLITDPLVSTLNGAGLSVQPDYVDLETELLELIDSLVVDCGACDAAATQNIVKGACTAAMASGAAQMH